LPMLGLPPEKHVVVSGIGCAGRFPYYMNTYGFHTIHGRAFAVATGLKAMRDDLTVWVVSGDGDALSIGGNHLLHCLRRNVNVKILLVNNQVYGLTKGQFSPTSPAGQKTKTSPEGVSVAPVNPLQFALAAGASFVARAVDKDPAHLIEVLKAAHAHQGAALIEIYQDCHIFNAGAFDKFAVKAERAEHTVCLEAGKPMVFGKALQLVVGTEGLSVVPAGTNDTVHHPENFTEAMQLAGAQYPELPVPLGIFYQKARPIYTLYEPVQKTKADLQALFTAKACWTEG
jgi:2-oxoglutarate ferredoxin oxidoreductase subunit beta